MVCGIAITKVSNKPLEYNYHFTHLLNHFLQLQISLLGLILRLY